MQSFICKLLLLGMLTAVAGARAEDIDLFVGTPPSVTDIPNVLVILDNTANWNTPFTNEIAALSSVVSALPADKFRVGLMLFTETGGGNSGNDGAYVRAAIRQLSAANKLSYQALVDNLDVGDDKGNGGKIAKAMEEAYLYFSAGVPHAGNNKKKTDFTGNSGVNASSDAIYALPANALPAKAATRYNSPLVSGCAKNFVIYISNGAAQDNNSDITQATAALAALGGSTSTIAINPSGSQDNVADEWARFMKKSSLEIVTYTVDVNKVTTGQGPGWTALLRSMALVSKGKYFDVSSSGTDIADALVSIFSEIQPTNSVFASVSLPVSVNTQGTYLNQVFVGMFRPDAGSLPRWFGNLKQYKLGMTDGVLKLQDADGSSAINASTGFVTACARSFWTPLAPDDYWGFSPSGTCGIANSDASNSPDGNIVEKGAQAYRLRTDSSRTMKTCSPVFATCATTSALDSFDTANTAITQSLLGVASASERSSLINWARGQDLKDVEENANGITTENRASIHGDVVHSRPVAINYGTDAAPQVVVYYGGNDGALRAVNGNRSAAIDTDFAAGSELWSFVPPEFYASLKRLYDNTTTISFPGHTTSSSASEPTPLPKAYGFDGPVTALQDGGESWLYSTMRRGGRVLYAFDVTSPTAPVMKWKRGCPNNIPASGAIDDTDCTTGFTGIGQTWSSPRSFKASGYGGGNTPLLIIGGGYDTCEDGDPQTCSSSTKGNHAYVLDADTGTLLKTFDTERSVVADIALVPDSSGRVIYAYVVDMGGNVYRISMGALAPAAWSMVKIADLGCSTTADCNPNRKFMFTPDVLADAGGYVLLLGSGDREKPLLSYTGATSVSNYFFMLKDQPTNASWLSSENSNCGADVLCLTSLQAITGASTPSAVDLGLKKGWYLGLTAAEQVVTSAITVFGVVTFSTHQPTLPAAGLCSDLGVARVYNVNYRNAEGKNGERYELLAGGGLPPSPVAGLVTLDDGSTVPFIIGANPDSPLEGSPPASPTTVKQPAARVYWNIEN
ncbi:MAG: pilus assembly protein PilY [Pseudomonadales bacterium RIFCSPLOWO2_12_59_9]|nr:MAG: pilus assembly protein PilY [Pseudomonadales bacterium RIFCSPLOWO2_12_59_9]